MMGLWVYALRILKMMCNPHCIFGELATDDDTSRATYARAAMKKRDRCKERKESLGKETDALDPDEHFDAVTLMLGSLALCLCVYGGGEGSRCIKDHAVSSGNLFSNMLHRVILYCLRVFT